MWHEQWLGAKEKSLHASLSHQGPNTHPPPKIALQWYHGLVCNQVWAVVWVACFCQGEGLEEQGQIAAHNHSCVHAVCPVKHIKGPDLPLVCLWLREPCWPLLQHATAQVFFFPLTLLLILRIPTFVTARPFLEAGHLSFSSHRKMDELRG